MGSKADLGLILSLVGVYTFIRKSFSFNVSTNEEEPYKLAIRECIKKGVLAEYLSRKGSEVENMFAAEYDYNMDIQVQRQEAEEIGRIMGSIMAYKECDMSAEQIICKIQRIYGISEKEAWNYYNQC